MLSQFKLYLSLERGLSSNSIDAYINDLNDFTVFQETQLKKNLKAIRKDDLLDYCEDCKSRDLNDSTISRRLVTLKIFFRFLHQEKIIAKDISEHLESARLSRILPDYLSIEEIEKLLQLYDESIPLEFRNKFIIELLYSCGLRISELCGLRTDSFNYESGFLRVKGKGSKERSIPFGTQVVAMSRQYIKSIRPQLCKKNNPPELIVSNNGRPLTRSRVWQFLKEAAHKAEISKNLHPHVLRHSFASHLLANNADLRIIQELLGHADIATTEIYTHVEKTRLQNIHQKFFPRA
ncbi:site-specific tyrosine recombinase XerD [Lentisphaera marina]|uniref:site-specific tyrosine recombinase XerD n=1 Tax=Lentisphaera marina TaxID=1111041 RepID=UPI0023655D0C|nr:site-specific tyrosine recombinase XerD [Lentisphaera marina]MDD7983522.1 site-specific tyrosine recombinase XerD [Lentisphaera marina]